MRLDEIAEASELHAMQAAREKAEERFGLTGDALIARLLLRYDDERRASATRKAKLHELHAAHEELRAKYGRLKRLLCHNGLMADTEETT